MTQQITFSPAQCHREGLAQVLSADGLTARFDSTTGALRQLCTADMQVAIDAPWVDVGVDGAYAMDLVAFQSFLPFATWELPAIALTGKSATWQYVGMRFAENEQALHVTYRCGPLEITIISGIHCGCLLQSVQLRNVSAAVLWINGVAFHTGLTGAGRFDFPGNVPTGVFDAAALAAGEVTQTKLITAVTHIALGERHLNALFIDPEERWSTAVVREASGIGLLHLAAVEANLAPDETLVCGNLYLQPVAQADHYAPIHALYAQNGWLPPADGDRDAVVYSCHPSGTMDTHFPLQDTLTDAAAYLPALHEMGVTHLWLLPVFDHADRRCYHPTDQAVIDPRYGGEAGMKRYADAAHALGMKVLFDYVPHGPQNGDPQALAYQDQWGSVRRDGTLQEEWNCLSFDMANPTYAAYTYDLVCDHVRRFGLDGARIDCAMGGLSNWRPYPGNRPSTSNIKGGVLISQAIRRAFVESGKTPFVTPENFHPIPLYNSATDAYYDMALYQVLFELNHAELTVPEYVRRLADWLEGERRVGMPGVQRLRFLGNHDTVSWVWDAKRATALYGVAKACAMWALIFLIDGIPMIYQGDEDSALYLQPGLDLKPFFGELFRAKRRYTSADYETEYLRTGTAVFAFLRTCGDIRRLVVVNLDASPATFAWSTAPGQLLYGQAEVVGSALRLAAYGYAMFDV